jgi:hypothetical protein
MGMAIFQSTVEASKHSTTGFYYVCRLVMWKVGRDRPDPALTSIPQGYVRPDPNPMYIGITRNAWNRRYPVADLVRRGPWGTWVGGWEF